MVCWGRCFGDMGEEVLEGAWNSLGSYMYLVYRPGRNFVILDSALSCPTSSPSINHVSSAFRTNLELGSPHFSLWSRPPSSVTWWWDWPPHLASCFWPRPLPPVLLKTTRVLRSERGRPLLRTFQWYSRHCGQSHRSLRVPQALLIWLLPPCLSDIIYYPPASALSTPFLSSSFAYCISFYAYVFYLFIFCKYVLFTFQLYCILSIPTVQRTPYFTYSSYYYFFPQFHVSFGQGLWTVCSHLYPQCQGQYLALSGCPTLVCWPRNKS